MKKFWLIFTILFMISSNVFASGMDQGGMPTPDDCVYSDKSGSLSNAISQAGKQNKALCVISNYNISSAVTVSVPIYIYPGGSFTKVSSGTINFTKYFQAGLYQVFSGFAAGDVTFGAGSVKEVYSEWWGAKGDGITEDTTALQSALNAFPNLFLLSNRTYITNTLTLNSNNAIIGQNRLTSILKAKANIANSVLYATGKTGLTVQGISLDGNSANQSSMVIGIDFQNSSKIWIEDNEIYNNSGSYEVRILSTTTNMSTVRVKGNNIYRSVADTGAGSFLFVSGTDAAPYYTVSDVLIENNHIHADVSSAAKDGMELVGTSDITIVRNRIYAMGQYGISFDVDNVNSIKILDNISYSNGYAGIAFNGVTSVNFPTSILVSGNSCLSNTQDGILISYVPRAIVTGNHCIANGYRGIEVNSSTAVSIEVFGNICIDNGARLTTTNAAGIWINSAVGTIVDGNVAKNVNTTNQQYGLSVNSASAGTIIGKNDFSGNATGATYIYGTVLPQPVSITVGSSPFTYTNNTGNEIDVLVTGGTVSDISVTKQAGWWTVAVATNVMVRLSINDMIRVTYSSTPTMTYFPR